MYVIVRFIFHFYHNGLSVSSLQLWHYVSSYIIMKNKNNILKALILVCFVTVSQLVNAQTKVDLPAGKELFNQIAAMDSVLFKCFNTCDTTTYKTLLADDLEFYHDKGGFTKSGRAEVESLKEMCGRTNKLRRELVKGSMEVYPISNYGAIEIATHSFYLKKPGEKEFLVTTAKFVHVWQKKDGKWILARVISYDHVSI